jgi:hypothetical protein
MIDQHPKDGKMHESSMQMEKKKKAVEKMIN